MKILLFVSDSDKSTDASVVNWCRSMLPSPCEATVVRLVEPSQVTDRVMSTAGVTIFRQILDSRVQRAVNLTDTLVSTIRAVTSDQQVLRSEIYVEDLSIALKDAIKSKEANAIVVFMGNSFFAPSLLSWSIAGIVNSDICPVTFVKVDKRKKVA